jgi:FkbM family methyltransferase
MCFGMALRFGETRGVNQHPPGGRADNGVLSASKLANHTNRCRIYTPPGIRPRLGGVDIFARPSHLGFPKGKSHSMQVKTIEIGGRSFEVAGHESDLYFQHLDLTNVANAGLCQLIWQDLKPGSVIFDVGANIGVTTCLFSKVVQSPTVYSFEPGTKARTCLLETLRLNSLPTDRVFGFGLGDRSAKHRFFEADMMAGSYVVTDAHPMPELGSSEIEVRTLDDFMDQQAIDRLDFIKIDVEGFEPEVINGAARTLQRFRPTVTVEFNSYCLIGVRNMNPRTFLDQLLATFPTVAWWDRDHWQTIRSGRDQHEMIYANLMRDNCVNDLRCSFDLAPTP